MLAITGQLSDLAAAFQARLRDHKLDHRESGRMLSRECRPKRRFACLRGDRCCSGIHGIHGRWKMVVVQSKRRTAVQHGLFGGFYSAARTTVAKGRQASNYYLGVWERALMGRGGGDKSGNADFLVSWGTMPTLKFTVQDAQKYLQPDMGE